MTVDQPKYSKNIGAIIGDGIPLGYGSGRLQILRKLRLNRERVPIDGFGHHEID